MLDCPLSEMELMALQSAAIGIQAKQAAGEMGITYKRYRNLLSSAYARLGVDGDQNSKGGARPLGAALALCFRRGWLDVDFDRVRQASHDEEVTWDQRLYLAGFDRHLAARDDEHLLRRAKVLTDAALDGLRPEAVGRLPRLTG